METTRSTGALRVGSSLTAALTAALTLASCRGTGEGDWVDLASGATDAPEAMHILGTVQRLEVEGGTYVIRDAGGTRYSPTNLPENYRVDGLSIEAFAQPRNDMASITMTGPLVELLRIRKRPSSEEPNGAPLTGTAWRLEDLGGAGVVDRVEATLALAPDGTVSGNASCNQFHGSATVSGSEITFGPLATTRKMCVEAVMNQETRYLAALQGAERFEIDGSVLYVHATGLSAPLRFVAASAGQGAG